MHLKNRLNLRNWLPLAWALATAAVTPQVFAQVSPSANERPGRVHISSAARESREESRSAPSDGRRVSTSAARSGQIRPASQATVESAAPKSAALQPANEPPDSSESDPLEDLLNQPATPIDLLTALQLAGEQNPTILLGQQRVVEAVAQRQLAAAQFLPTLNLGTNVDAHWGVLQQSNGNILSVRREAVFVGAGANAIAAGTVNIPGVLWTLNVSDAIYNYLTSRQEVEVRDFASQATRQDELLKVALAYNELVRSEGIRAVAILARRDARELARITAAYVKTGQGRQPDADRAATELARRDARLLAAHGEVVRASAALCQTLHLDPSLRLHAADNQVIPRAIVPDPIPLPELLALALLHRPELNERRAAVEKSLNTLNGAQLLPFSPTVFLGFSAGGFGGGSDLVAEPTSVLPFGRGAPRFSSLENRADLDVMAYWTLQNLGVGNKSQIEAARSRAASADLELLITLDRIRSEVAAAHTRTFARFARIRSCELAISAGTQALAEDLERVRGAEGLPLEAIDSLRLLAESRLEYLDSIIDYNRSQFELFVALGQPPADLLIRPAELPSDSSRPPPERPQPNDAAPAGTTETTRIEKATPKPRVSHRKRRSVVQQVAGTAVEIEPLEGLQRGSVLPASYEERLIDLPTALQLAENTNPTIALGRQSIVEAVALQTGARGLLLPTLNAGSNYHLHQGALQTSFGLIRNFTEQSIYVGGGARTLAAETVAIPAVRIFSHLGDAIFAPLAAEQVVSARSFDATSINNDTLLLVIRRYLELAVAEASLDAIHVAEDDAQAIVEATAAFTKTGAGREGDYQRARADALLLHAQEQELQERAGVAAAELSRVLHLDPSLRLRTRPGPLELVQLVDPDYSLDSLVDLAQSARPELAARTAEIAAAEYRVRQEKTRPLLPVISAGFSGGAFGGGGNALENQQFFQTFGGRTDFDVTAVWTLQNLGFGNAAAQKQSRAVRDQAIAARQRMTNRVAREVGDAYTAAEAHKQQVLIAQQRYQSAVAGAREELARTRGGEGLPIEALNSVRLLSEAGLALVEAIGSYDLAQFELFVAIGQTPHTAVPDPQRDHPESRPKP
ncbi:MAG: TolC family protein [Planctomycetes bacterium]|nr:TolC family protein [Planctomycetota bacterium]